MVLYSQPVNIKHFHTQAGQVWENETSRPSVLIQVLQLQLDLKFQIFYHSHVMRLYFFRFSEYMNGEDIRKPVEVQRQLECMRKEQSLLNTKRLELLNSLR